MAEPRLASAPIEVHRDLHDGASYRVAAPAPGVTTLQIRDDENDIAAVGLDRGQARQLVEDLELVAGLRPTGARVERRRRPPRAARGRGHRHRAARNRRGTRRGARRPGGREDGGEQSQDLGHDRRWTRAARRRRRQAGAGAVTRTSPPTWRQLATVARRLGVKLNYGRHEAAVLSDRVDCRFIAWTGSNAADGRVLRRAVTITFLELEHSR